MTTPENKPQVEVEALKARIASDMQAQGLRIGEEYITKMVDIVTAVRDAQTAGDIRDLLGDISSQTAGQTARIAMRSLPSNPTPISDDDYGWRLRRSTARLLAEDAFGNGQHAQSPRLIPYIAGLITRPSTSSGIQGRPINRLPSL